ncbi:hypothetical protein [Photobacterium galatheae]|uniref:Uncharacterized protein n=1 Tax=Photobacterium galatheae TaxID=1654360 RepID=A0A066RKI0_9GAMM|nr:hypothetical protein [Photobacterium galatheae]KDM90844.1 hypothetical protein EA58_13875 [Photobacterium galatheae]MCM0149188.1 hypothetical protein [Photobacterium galatheae]
MNQDFIQSLKIAISLDSIDFAKDLFSSPSGFFIQFGEDQFAKIQGGNDLFHTDIHALVQNPNIEYSLSSSEFLRVKDVAAGMGCGVNKTGKINLIGDDEQNFENAKNDHGHQVFEVKSPNGVDISKMLAACVVHGRKEEHSNTNVAKSGMSMK